MNQEANLSEPTVHAFRSKEGQLIELVPLKPAHAPLLVELFQHMGPESRFLRFNVPLTNPDPNLVWSEARRMATVDETRDGAWLAFADLPGEVRAPVGGVRYMRTDEETAEAALVVRDDMQNQGIGGQLLSFLVRQAGAAGICRLTATVNRSNLPLWRLIHNSGLAFDLASEGSMAAVTVHLPPSAEH